MIIKHATIEDALAISTIQHRSWQHAYKGIIPQDYLDSMNLEERTQRWKKGLKDNSCRQRLVIEVENKVIGFSVYGASREDDANEEKNSEVHAIYLNPDFIGQGFGKALMNKTLSNLKKQNYEDCIIWALKDNHQAISFYQRAGFEIVQNKKKMFDVAGASLE